MSLTSNNSYSTMVGATTSGMLLPLVLNEEVQTYSSQDYNIDELVTSQPTMINATAVMDSIPHNWDINEGAKSKGPNDALDTLNSDNKEDHTCIPNSSSPPKSSNGFDFCNYECFKGMGFGKPIEDNYGGNNNNNWRDKRIHVKPKIHGID